MKAFDIIKEAFLATPDPSFAEIEMSLPVKLDQTPNVRENESSSSSDESDGSGSGLKPCDTLKPGFAATSDPSFAEIEMSLPVKRDETPDEHENESSSSSDEFDGSENGLTAFDTVKEAFAVTADPSFAEIEMSLSIKLDETPNEREKDSSSSSVESDGSDNGLTAFDTVKEAFAVTPDPSFAEIEMSLPVKRDESPDEHENESSSSSDESDGSDNVLTAFDTVKEAFAATPDPSLAEIEMSLPIKLYQTSNERENESSSSSDEPDGSGRRLKACDDLKEAFVATPKLNLFEIEMSLPVTLDRSQDEGENESSSRSEEFDCSGKRLKGFDKLKEAFVATPEPSLVEIAIPLNVEFDNTQDGCVGRSCSSSDEFHGNERYKEFESFKERFDVIAERNVCEMEITLHADYDKRENEREKGSVAGSDESVRSGRQLKESNIGVFDRNLGEAHVLFPIGFEKMEFFSDDGSSLSIVDDDASEILDEKVLLFKELERSFDSESETKTFSSTTRMVKFVNQSQDEQGVLSDSSNDDISSCSVEKCIQLFKDLENAFDSTVEPSISEKLRIGIVKVKGEFEESTSDDDSNFSGRRVEMFETLEKSFVDVLDRDCAGGDELEDRKSKIEACTGQCSRHSPKYFNDDIRANIGANSFARDRSSISGSSSSSISFDSDDQQHMLGDRYLKSEGMSSF